MNPKSRLRELRTAAGSPRELASKLALGARTVATLASPRERRRRIDRLVEHGLADAQPTGWQLAQAAHHMLFGFLLPSNLEFYAHYEQDHHWQQVLRFVDDPSGMLDPVGLAISRESLVAHLIQVVHTSAGYDIALLVMFDGGLELLRSELERVIARTHPRQQAIELILEQPDYPERLLAALDRWLADPEAHWEAKTWDAPADCEPRFAWGLERFGTPGRLLRYACTLPETPLASARAWSEGRLAVPGPPVAATR